MGWLLPNVCTARPTAEEAGATTVAALRKIPYTPRRYGKPL